MENQRPKSVIFGIMSEVCVMNESAAYYAEIEEKARIAIMQAQRRIRQYSGLEFKGRDLFDRLGIKYLCEGEKWQIA